MKTYFDRYNLVHDKPTDGIHASSGNGFIYTAYYSAITGKKYDLRDLFYREIYSNNTLGLDIKIIRHPDKTDIASLDEIVGMIYLDLMDYELLSNNDMRWFDTLYSPKWYHILQSVIYCAGKHRNFFKDNNVRDLHPIAYWVPWHIQYYAIKRINKRKIMPFRALMFYLWLLSVVVKRNYKNVYSGDLRRNGSKRMVKEKQTGAISQKNIAWLVLRDLKNPLHKLIDHERNFHAYFDDADHPIRLKIKESK